MRWMLALALALFSSTANSQTNLHVARNQLLQEHAALMREFNARSVERQQNANVYNSMNQSGMAAQFAAQQHDLLRRIQAADARIAAIRQRLAVVSANIQRIDRSLARPQPTPPWRPPHGGGRQSGPCSSQGCLLGQC